MTAAGDLRTPAVTVPGPRREPVGTAGGPRDPLAMYGRLLRRAARGRRADFVVLDAAGRRAPVRGSAARWCGDLHPGDQILLDRCHGDTLDIGCGPGRLAAALTRRDVPVLGIDICAEAVRQARLRGAPARLACVLTSDLGARWQHLLLADGNIGIGGNPARLLAHCRAALLRPGGDLLVEVGPPGTGSWSGPVALVAGRGRSAPFPWAVVAADDLCAVATMADLRVREIWTGSRRWFARITA